MFHDLFFFSLGMPTGVVMVWVVFVAMVIATGGRIGQD